jgi:hypothetical protein
MKVRIKTEEEFKADDKWNARTKIPIGWNYLGKMNHFMGTTVELTCSQRDTAKRAGMFFIEDGENSWMLVDKDYIVEEDTDECEEEES